MEERRAIFYHEPNVTSKIYDERHELKEKDRYSIPYEWIYERMGWIDGKETPSKGHSSTGASYEWDLRMDGNELYVVPDTIDGRKAPSSDNCNILHKTKPKYG